MAFCDPSGGSGDGYTLCVAHAEGVNVVVDALHEVRPPFDPDEATERLSRARSGLFPSEQAETPARGGQVFLDQTGHARVAGRVGHTCGAQPGGSDSADTTSASDETARVRNMPGVPESCV